MSAGRIARDSAAVAARPARTGPTDDDLIRRVGVETLAGRAGLELSGRARGSEHAVRCPWHEDTTPSASLNLERGVLFCHPCNRGASLVQLYAEQAHGGDLRAARAALRILVGDTPTRPRPAAATAAPTQRIITGPDPSAIATWTYRDEHGDPIFRVCRKRDAKGKKFFHQQPALGGDRWRHGSGVMDGVRRVLYRLPELIDSDACGPVYICEGEKCSDAVVALGLVATTNAGGAGKWRPEYSEHLRGRAVAILPDCDPPNPKKPGHRVGMDHAIMVAKSLSDLGIEAKIVELPGLNPTGEDVVDWLAAGGDRAQLEALADAAPLWHPAEDSCATEDEGAPADADDPADRRPVILDRDELSPVTDEAEDALLASGEPLYCRGGALVTVIREHPTRDRRVERDAAAPILAPVSAARLRELCDKSARWVQEKGRDKKRVPALVPDFVPETLLARGSWPFPHVRGIITAPTMREDGSILAADGLDVETGLLVSLGGAWPAVPDRPTRADVDAARAELLAPLAEFPFVGDADRAVAVAAVLTAIARHAVAGPVPMTAIRATAAGSGKTLCADAIAIIATGCQAAKTTPTADASEWRKLLLSVAIAGDPVVLFDNLVGAVGGAQLAAAITAGEIRDRVLGESRVITVPLAPVWLATGNNLTFRGDLGRRVLACDLDAGEEFPEDRQGPAGGEAWTHADLLGHVRARRRELVAAALVILRAYHVAGRPRHKKPRKGSFERWDDLIRGACVWSGIGDPVGTTDRIRDEGDADREALRSALLAWHTAFGDSPMTAAEVARRVAAPELAELWAALSALAPARRDAAGMLDPAGLAYALRGVRDRPCVGLRFRQAPRDRSRDHARRWYVEGAPGGGRQ